jgi:hypothetical protein
LVAGSGAIVRRLLIPARGRLPQVSLAAGRPRRRAIPRPTRASRPACRCSLSTAALRAKLSAPCTRWPTAASDKEPATQSSRAMGAKETGNRPAEEAQEGLAHKLVLGLGLGFLDAPDARACTGCGICQRGAQPSAADTRDIFSATPRGPSRAARPAARQDAARAARQRDSCAAASPQLLPTSCARPHAPLRAPPPLSGAPRLPQALAPVACAGSGACSARQRTGRARHRRMPHGMAGGVCSTRQCDRGGARGRRACAPASPVRPSQRRCGLVDEKGRWL